MTMPTLAIIGCGKVGKTLGRCWTANGAVSITDIVNRSIDSARDAAAFIGAGRALDDIAALQPADIYLIGTGDDALASAGALLAASGRVPRGAVVFHCSGLLGASVLQPLQAQGAAVASIHPIRSFADPGKAAAEFAGTFCGAEGDPAALAALEPLFEAIGGRLVPIDARNKRIYHAAAVFASNYLVTLLDVARNAYIEAGIAPDLALQLLAPLVRNTVDNVMRLGPAKALTGPIARGDLAAAVDQLQAVTTWNADSGELYRQLARSTAALAGQPQQVFDRKED